MARLERVGDRTELVIDGMAPLPWHLGERPEYGLTLPPELQVPDARVAGPGAGPDPLSGERSAIEGALFSRERAEEKAQASLPDAPPENISRASRESAGEKRDHEAATARVLKGASGVVEGTDALKGIAVSPETMIRQGFGAKPGESKKAEPEKLRGDGEKTTVATSGLAPFSAYSGSGGGPVRKIPGGIRLDTREIKRGNLDAKELGEIKGAYEQSDKSNREALATGAAMQVARNSAEADLVDNERANQYAHIQNVRALNAKANEESDAVKAELDNERGDIDALKADPYRYWASKGAGTKVLAAIGMLFAGLKGPESSNAFMKQIQEIMANDKADRDARIKAREQGLQFRESDWEKKRGKLDASTGAIETEARQWASVESQLRSFGLRSKNPEIQATAAKLADDAKLEKLKGYAAVDAQNTDQIVDKLKNVPDQYVGGAPRLKPEERALAVTLPGGRTLFARSAPDANALRKKVASASYLGDRLREVRNLVAKGKADRVWWSENRGSIEALMGDIAGSYKEAKELGTLDAGVERLLDKAVGDPTSILQWDDKALRKLDENARLQTQTVENVANYQLDETPSGLSAPGVVVPGMERQ